MPKTAGAVIRDQSPPLMPLGIIYALLFNAGLLAVSPLFASGSFPAPSSTGAQIVAFFRANGGPVTITSALQFGSAIPLGLYRRQSQTDFVSSGYAPQGQHRPVRRLDVSSSDAPRHIGDVGNGVGRFDG